MVIVYQAKKGRHKVSHVVGAKHRANNLIGLIAIMQSEGLVTILYR